MEKRKKLNMQDIHIFLNKNFITITPTETRQLGMQFAKFLKKGDLVLLYGECGSGKTTFVQGIVRAFSNVKFAKSASFIIINEYKAFYKTKLFHLDLYRLKQSDIYNLGLEEYIYSNNIALIEWPNRLLDIEKNYNGWKICFTQEYNNENNNKRIIRIYKIK
jgi:tRNA threonylcarbamoyladenosine biosynthesis protein TsaE